MLETASQQLMTSHCLRIRAQRINTSKAKRVFTKESGLALLQNAAVEAERLDQSSEAAMILRRPQIHPYATKMPKPPAQISACGRCFAQFVLRDAAEWAQAQAAARPQPGDAESL